MSRYLVRRLLMLVLTLWGLSVLVFVAMRMIPGDTIDMILGTEYVLPEAQKIALRRYFGLDKPIPQQYLSWLISALRGDMGLSIRTGRPVLTEALARFPLTIQLATFALIVALLMGIPLGIVSALRPDSVIDGLARLFSLLGMALPDFVVATLLILILSVYFHWYPVGGNFVGFVKDPALSFRQLVFPALSLGVAMAAGVARMTRSSMLEVLRQDYVRTARSKGLSESAVVITHCLKNALIPVITLVGIQFGRLLGGTVIIEEIFALPGIGRLTLYAIYQRDYAMVQACVLFIALCYIGMNLVADIAYAFVDPRIRYQ